MKPKRTERKLSLNKETIRELTPRQLQRVAGGATNQVTTPECCPPTIVNCPPTATCWVVDGTVICCGA